jgi:hypothetical protein
MAYEALREKGLVEDVKPNFQVVSTLIARALRDLATARANSGTDREWAYAIAGISSEPPSSSRGRSWDRRCVRW